MFWILRTGAPWRDLPQEFGAWQTVWRLFDQWNGDGTVDKLLSELQISCNENAGPDDNLWCIDGSVIRASRCAAGGGKRGSISFQGVLIYGQGFLLSPDEASGLVEKDPRNADRIFEYIGGDELNSSPTLSHDRYVINFGRMSLSEAEAWPDLIRIVRERVKPERDARDHNAIARRQKKHWWLFRSDVPELRVALSELRRCIATGQQASYHRFAFQPCDRVFSQKAFAFALESWSAFSCLQSRVHRVWALLLGGRMGAANTPVYSKGNCFETFPFPGGHPDELISGLERPGEAFDSARSDLMRAESIGLTAASMWLEELENDDPRVLELRRLHEQMDRAVLDAYGWTDIDVPSFCAGSSTAGTDADRAALTEFEDEVIDRLYVLNAERAQEEERLGLRKKKGKKGKRDKKAVSRKASKSSDSDEQGKLF